MNTPQEEDLLRFINGHLLAEKGGIVTSTTALFAEGWIDSLKILELIAYLEMKRGADIPDREIVMNRFQNVQTICREFLQNSTHQ